MFSRRINAPGKNVSVCVTVMDILLGKNNNEMDVEVVGVKQEYILRAINGRARIVRKSVMCTLVVNYVLLHKRDIYYCLVLSVFFIQYSLD